MKEIIKVCRYLAGINSSGMSALKEDFEQLTTKQIEKIDPFNANLWGFYGKPKKIGNIKMEYVLKEKMKEEKSLCLMKKNHDREI
ncbi:hypothetical protein M2256_001412 [Lactococcus lactis]|uniref:Uncharacterized protein n=1 Tax=Lactococcus lactis TaxID=1358 RepID=A0AAW5TIK1_9LACT|nr:hypothetical protein [Lactococcus lactis]MCW2280954.1 hypothetical protein [Lactococcus lactis]